MFNIQEDNTTEALLECIELGRSHNAEVMDSEYEPDAATLDVVLKAGLMNIVTVRENGVLVGYWLNMVTRDFISGKVIGREAAFYIAPEVRGSTAFHRMIKLVEKTAKDKGAVSQLIMFEEGHDNGLAQRLGYQPLERTYIKKLGDG